MQDFQDFSPVILFIMIFNKLFNKLILGVEAVLKYGSKEPFSQNRNIGPGIRKLTFCTGFVFRVKLEN